MNKTSSKLPSALENARDWIADFGELKMLRNMSDSEAATYAKDISVDYNRRSGALSAEGWAPRLLAPEVLDLRTWLQENTN